MARMALDAELTAVGAQDALRDEETETRAATVGVPVAIEDVGQVLGADAGTGIRDFERNAVVCGFDDEGDAPNFGREFQRVAEEVAEHLQQAVAIAAHEDAFAFRGGLELD